MGVYQAGLDRGSSELKLLIHPRTDVVISASNKAALRLRVRGETSRQVESVLACNILNQFRLLGRPQCELIT